MNAPKLKISHFGPIINGYKNNGGYIEFTGVTIFCGNQGVGKSCVAKLFSTMSWIEKSLNRGDYPIKYFTQYNRFRNTFCAFHNLSNYFSSQTFIHYIGINYEILYSDEKLTIAHTSSDSYIRPQIMYIPAERNLLSVIENADNIKSLPQSLSSMLDVYNKACRDLKTAVLLPVNNLSFKYDSLNKIHWLSTDNYKIKISEASSGLQSLTPMFITLEHLFKTTTRYPDKMDNNKSLKEKEILQKRLAELLNDNTIDDETRKNLIQLQSSSTKNQRILFIIEEPEQNLFPTSQRQVLNSLLSYCHEDKGQIVITTHSPYIIDYLSLAVKAYHISNEEKIRIDAKKISRINKIVPAKSQIDGKNVSVYQIDDIGNIFKLPKYDDMPSDNNYLNNLLAETNNLFNNLLDISENEN